MNLKAVVCAAACLCLFMSGCDRKDEKPITQSGSQKQGAPSSLPMAPGAGVTMMQDPVGMLESVLKNDPKNLDAHIKLGNIYMDSERFNEAVKHYASALEIDPKNSNVRVDMGTCYRKLGRSDIAVKEYREAIKRTPNHAYAHMNLGVVLANDMMQYGEALKEYETFLKLAPADPNAALIHQEIAKIKAMKGQAK